MTPRIVVNSELPWPLPVQVRRAIVAEIAAGTFPEGSRLPPERELATRFLVSRKTVRAALGELEAAGRITRHVGRGTFVKVTPPKSAREKRPFPHVGIVFFKYTDPHRDPLTARLFEGMHELMREASIISTTYGLTCIQGDDYKVLVQDVLQMNFDVVVMAPHAVEGPLDAIARKALVLQVGYHIEGDGRSYVGCDLVPGLREAVGHLRGLGHRRIGYLSAEREDDYEHGGQPGKLRAFETVASGFGDVDAPVFWRSDVGAALRGSSRPTALITAQTGQAKAVLAASRELGIRVPDELSLISFDDGDIGEATRPRFSGIRVLSKELGRRGAEVLKDLLEGAREAPVRETREPELVIRETCARAPR